MGVLAVLIVISPLFITGVAVFGLAYTAMHWGCVLEAIVFNCEISLRKTVLEHSLKGIAGLTIIMLAAAAYFIGIPAANAHPIYYVVFWATVLVIAAEVPIFLFVRRLGRRENYAVSV